MLGIPRPDFPDPDPVKSSDEPSETQQSSGPPREPGAAPEPPVASRRTRARVRYDSANEPLSVTARRRKALRGLAVLIVLSAAWIGYRLLTLNA
jgi:membrane glycosyltransferase